MLRGCMGSCGGENGHLVTLDLRGVAIRDGAGARPQLCSSDPFDYGIESTMAFERLLAYRLSMPTCPPLVLRVLFFSAEAAVDFSYTAVQGNSRRVAYTLPDFDGKCARMGMASWHITVISPSNTVGHIASYVIPNASMQRLRDRP